MKTIEEKNRMIAEFIGVLQYRPGGDYIERFGDPYEIEDAQYHASWDWLIPVVYTIHNLLNDKWFEGHDTLSFSLFPSSIDELYGQVVEFIEWYNENKQDL